MFYLSANGMKATFDHTRAGPLSKTSEANAHISRASHSLGCHIVHKDNVTSVEYTLVNLHIKHTQTSIFPVAETENKP